jgi:hypothetical protein
VASPFILIVAILTIESSYTQNIERPARVVPDTVQFWLAQDQTWRVKTFSVDHDIHVHSVGASPEGQRLSVAVAQANIRKTYGDVLSSLLVVEIEDPSNKSAVASVLKRHGLTGSLEVSPSGVAFYNPDGGRYRSQSKPTQATPNPSLERP